MITKRQLQLIIAAFVALVMVAVGSLIYQSIQVENSFKITEEATSESSDIIDVDYKDQSQLLTSEQKRKLPETMRSKTSKEIPDSTELSATIRNDSTTVVGNETLFIIDIEQLQTSYLISRYTDPAESLDLVNVLCAPADKRIYEPDYCRED